MKQDNPLIILTSNRSMSEHCKGKWYRQESEAVLFTRTFKARVLDFCLDKPLFSDFSLFRKTLLECTEFHPITPKIVPSSTVVSTPFFALKNKEGDKI